MSEMTDTPKPVDVSPEEPAAAAADTTTAAETAPTPEGDSSGEKKDENADEQKPSEIAETSDEAVETKESNEEVEKQLEEDTKRLASLAIERRKQFKEKLKVIQSDPDSHLHSAKNFTDLNLPEPLLRGIFEGMGFERPSQIQELALPIILSEKRKNLIAQAQSGSGKTAAFTLGMLYWIDPNLAVPQALCLAPTRELARQILENSVLPMAKFIPGLRWRLAIAGAPEDSVSEHIVIGTPGKVEALIKKRRLNTANVKVFVLDEADEMVAESGHRQKSLAIKRFLPNVGGGGPGGGFGGRGGPGGGRGGGGGGGPSGPTGPGGGSGNLLSRTQCLLFSATFSTEVFEFAKKIVHDPDNEPGIIKFETDEELVLDEIKQLWMDVNRAEGHNKKLQVLMDLYCVLTLDQSIVFAKSRNDCREIKRALQDSGFQTSLLVGDQEGSERDECLDRFRSGVSKVLITTNVLSRGVDIEGVSMVVNYDLPTTRDGRPDFETYLHRIGRTGRFGRRGVAVSLVSTEDDKSILESIAAHYNTPIQEVPADDIEEVETIVKRAQTENLLQKEAQANAANNNNNS